MHPLRAWLRENGITQRDFAERVGCSPNYVAELLTGARWPSRPLAEAIAEATSGEVRCTRVWMREGKYWHPAGARGLAGEDVAE